VDTPGIRPNGAGGGRGQARAPGANDRIRLGFIGLGNRGDQVLDAFLPHKDCEVAALCDLYQPYLDFAARKAGGQPRLFKDYRRLLEWKDLDAVVICTPDHWHALQMIEACQAGKDVYVEKPLSLRVAEGRRMVEAARKHRRVVQVGIHRRSVPFCQEAVQFVRSGALGKITVARAFHIQNEWPKGIGNPPDREPPPGLEWDAWLGPAPKVPYHKNRSFYRFRWFYDYSGGQVTNFGVHYLDFIQWALGQDAPLAVTAMGGQFAQMEDNRQIPDTLEVIWRYPGDTLVTFSQFNATAATWSLPGCEIELRGTKGTLYLFGSGYQVVPDEIKEHEFPARSPVDRDQEKLYRITKRLIEPKRISGQSSETTFHTRNFLDSVKSRQPCSCDIEIGHRSTSATLLANIAHQTRSWLQWDAKTEKFTNHAAANQWLNWSYRAPYKLPDV
jgi:predicted dehydrogenase